MQEDGLAIDVDGHVPGDIGEDSAQIMIRQGIRHDFFGKNKTEEKKNLMITKRKKQKGSKQTNDEERRKEGASGKTWEILSRKSGRKHGQSSTSSAQQRIGFHCSQKTRNLIGKLICYDHGHTGTEIGACGTGRRTHPWNDLLRSEAKQIL